MKQPRMMPLSQPQLFMEVKKNDEVTRSESVITTTFLNALYDLRDFLPIEIPNINNLIDYIENNKDLPSDYPTIITPIDDLLSRAMNEPGFGENSQIVRAYERYCNSQYYFQRFANYATSGDNLESMPILVGSATGGVYILNLEPYHDTEITLKDEKGYELCRKTAIKGKIIFDNLPSGKLVYIDSDYHYVGEKKLFYIP